ncbi:MAG: beta-ketoacyl-[acyl-carrier-protein] synthase family protein [Nitrospirae bacterium]|nr:beta-ketoacyl-[acyl-carrier-protein] synthase family protein [Nitrospirota bacterium]
MRRVAITGAGVVSPLGDNLKDLFDNLMEGRSGVRRLDLGSTAGTTAGGNAVCKAGGADSPGSSEPADFSSYLAHPLGAVASVDLSLHFSKKQLRQLDRATLFALLSASRAVSGSGLVFDEADTLRSGVYVGIGMGGARALEDEYVTLLKDYKSKVNPLTVTMVMNNAPASHISMVHGLKGPCLTYSIACSSSSVAIGEAYRQVRGGYADVMLAGGTESVFTFGVMKSWEALGTLAVEDPVDPSASCKPFSLNRSGFVIGEGAAMFVLEDMERALKRNAPILAELAGYGCTSDASHITRPTTEGQIRAMELAIKDAGVEPSGIDYINAHGTATAINDVVETQSIKAVFGKRAYDIPVSSTKSMHGHLIGASGALELAVTLLAVKNQAIPPTTHLVEKDPACDLDYVPLKGRTQARVRAAMSNSFAFGGTNGVIVLKDVR